MTCPRCTILLGLLAAALIAQEPQTNGGPSFTTGMRSVCVPGLQLYYTRNVSEAEAERVATWLVRAGLPEQFPGPMLFDHTDNSARIEMMATDAATARHVRQFAAGLSVDVLKGAPVRVCLRDVSGKTVFGLSPIEEGPFFYN